MKRWLMTGVVTEVTLLVWLMIAPPASAGSAFTAGARPAAGADAGRSIRGQSADATSTFVQEITAVFAATPTIGSLGDAVEASRTTFSTAEAIEFDAVLFESGLAGTRADLQLYLFNQDGRILPPTFVFNGVLAPADRTGFFIQLDPGSLPSGRLKWVMVISDAFGNAFATPFQTLNVQ
jgi:hypothetical protein